MGSRLAGVEVHLPQRCPGSAEVEALAGTGTAPDEVDLLLFAPASQDLVEPATARIVAAALGLSCPVMDVENAGNSVLDGLEVADALIGTGRYRTVLSDAGAALLVTAADRPGLLGFGSTADSRHWSAGTLGAGGSRHPRDVEHTCFAMDAAALEAAFLDVGTGVLDATRARPGIGWDDCAVVAVHQVSLPHLEVLADRPGVPRDEQLVTAREQGRCGPGDLVALVGPAGGVSLGIGVGEL